jgi:hypothetical protein
VLAVSRLDGAFRLGRPHLLRTPRLLPVWLQLLRPLAGHRGPCPLSRTETTTSSHEGASCRGSNTFSSCSNYLFVAAVCSVFDPPIRQIAHFVWGNFLSGIFASSLSTLSTEKIIFKICSKICILCITKLQDQAKKFKSAFCNKSGSSST